MDASATFCLFAGCIIVFIVGVNGPCVGAPTDC